MNLLAHIAPLDEAVKKFDAKSIVASKLRTAEWAKVPLELRDRALFSAGVEHVRFLSTAQQKLKDAIGLQREKVKRGEAIVDRSSIIGDMRKLALGEGLSDRTGGLTDVGSQTRLGLIYDMQLRMAQGFAQRKMDLDPDVLDAFPAQELVREEDRKMPRDWTARWQAAGGELVDGRMVALKTDPVWTKISRFGTPYPPFDFGSGMGLNDISRDEAEQLGLIAPGEAVPPEDVSFNDQLEASVEGLDTKFLTESFGDQVQIKDGKARWVGNLIGDFVGKALSEKDWKDEISLGSASLKAREKAAGIKDISGYRLSLMADDVRHAMRRHGDGSPDRNPINPDDFELASFVWRDPDEVKAGEDGALLFKKQLNKKLVSVDTVRSEKNKTFFLKTVRAES